MFDFFIETIGIKIFKIERNFLPKFRSLRGYSFFACFSSIAAFIEIVSRGVSSVLRVYVSGILKTCLEDSW